MMPAPARPRAAALTLASICLATLALAGCAEDHGSTTIAIDFAEGHEDLQGEVALDADGTMTAYEQLLAWSNATGVPVSIRAFSFGHCVDAIDGLPTTPGCSTGAEAYWALSVDGVPSETGMDLVELRDGMAVTWTYTPLGGTGGNGNASLAPPAPGLDPNPLGATIDPPAPTRTATATLTGSVSQPATVSIDGGPSLQVAAGRWSLETGELPLGQTASRVRIEDGIHSIAANVTFVRLASATVEALFTAQPGHAARSDEVWYDPSRLASSPMYEGTGADRATTYSVHDLLVDWTAQTGVVVEYGGPGDFGYSVDAIDGVGQPLSSALPPYWCYAINGDSAGVLGISLQTVAPGDVVTWEYSTCV